MSIVTEKKVIFLKNLLLSKGPFMKRGDVRNIGMTTNVVDMTSIKTFTQTL